jgi:hypothetical protein
MLSGYSAEELSMSSTESPQPEPIELPEILGDLFWDHDFSQLDWRTHRDFIIGRVLESGSWDAIRWLRSVVGDVGLRDWIDRREGRPLSAKQLRFWQLILEIPPERVDQWLDSPGRRIWEGRVRR